jgi:8-oxo-dGTP pyrophosphatase MutT (NUDIX family)
MRFERQPRSSFVKIEKLLAEKAAKEKRSQLSLGVMGLLIYRNQLGEEYLIMAHNQDLAEDRGKQEAVCKPYSSQPFFKNLRPVENRWYTVSGEVKADETSEQALIREAHEELGLEINLDQLQSKPVAGFKVKQLRPVQDKSHMKQALFEVVVLKTNITQQQLQTLEQRFGQSLRLIRLNSLASLNGQYPRRPSTEHAMNLLLKSLESGQLEQENLHEQAVSSIPQP